MVAVRTLVFTRHIDDNSVAFKVTGVLTAMADDPEVVSLLNGYSELLEAMRRLTTLADMLLQRASTATPLTSEEAAWARQETDAAREGIERIDATLGTLMAAG
jgi:hypothetical protein